MTDLTWALLLVYGPTLLICAAFYWWSRTTQIDWLCKLLSNSAKVGALYFLILIFAVVGIASTCDGNVLKGVAECTLLSDDISQFIVGLGFVSYALAMFYALILFTAAGLVEMLRPTQND